VIGSLIPQPRELVVEECADRVITESQNSVNEGVATFKEASLADGIEGECHTPIFDLRSYIHTLFDPE